MDDLFTLFTTRLHVAGIEFIVTGSVAAMVYGEQRPTHGVELVVVLDDDDVDALVDAFPAGEFYCPPADVIRIEARRAVRGHFVLVHEESGFRADVHVMGADSFDRWAMEHRRHVAFGDSTVPIAPAEYVIARKLEYYRECGSAKHIDDICGILRSSPDAIDAAELGRMIAARGLAPQWSDVEAAAAA
jgi:hypothetical protein